MAGLTDADKYLTAQDARAIVEGLEHPGNPQVDDIVAFYTKTGSGRLGIIMHMGIITETDPEIMIVHRLKARGGLDKSYLYDFQRSHYPNVTLVFYRP